jgi:hypothetical protein
MSNTPFSSVGGPSGAKLTLRLVIIYKLDTNGRPSQLIDSIDKIGSIKPIDSCH